MNAEGNIKLEDTINNYIIFSDRLIYKKNEEIIITDGNSKAIDQNNRVITARKFTYNKILNIINAEGNARIEDIEEEDKVADLDTTASEINQNVLIEMKNIAQKEGVSALFLGLGQRVLYTGLANGIRFAAYGTSRMDLMMRSLDDL